MSFTCDEMAYCPTPIYLSQIALIEVVADLRGCIQDSTTFNEAQYIFGKDYIELTGGYKIEWCEVVDISEPFFDVSPDIEAVYFDGDMSEYLIIESIEYDFEDTLTPNKLMQEYESL